MRIGIVGLGYWGPHYVRIFSQMRNVKHVLYYDKDRNQMEKIMGIGFEDADPAYDYDHLLDDVDAVVVATPATTHFNIAQQALLSNKHVLCEKPVTLTASSHDRLMQISKSHERVLFPGLTFMFHPVVNYIKKNFIVDDQPLGKPKYFYCQRTNYGPIRSDVNAVIDLAPHDLSIAASLFGALSLIESEIYHVRSEDKMSDAGMLNVYSKSGVRGHIHVSWMEPEKRRLMRIIFENGMLEYVDTDLSHPLRLYRIKGDQLTEAYPLPVDREQEPLTAMCQAFMQSASGHGYGLEHLQNISRNISSVLNCIENF